MLDLYTIDAPQKWGILNDFRPKFDKGYRAHGRDSSWRKKLHAGEKVKIKAELGKLGFNFMNSKVFGIRGRHNGANIIAWVDGGENEFVHYYIFVRVIPGFDNEAVAEILKSGNYLVDGKQGVSAVEFAN